MPRLAVPKTESIPTAKTRLFSCDDPQPFHLPVKPDAVHHQRNRDYKRSDRAGNVDRGAFYEVDPQAPHANSLRQQRRENDENNMESFKGHLAKDRVIVPRQECKPEEAKHKKSGENQDA